MKTRAAVLTKTGAPAPYAKSKPLEIWEVELAPPGPGEVLVRVAAAGVCHSDLSIINGDRPRATPIVLGHEASGVIEALAPARGHPEWEQVKAGWSMSDLRQQAQESLTDALNPFSAVRAELGRLGDWMPFGSGGDRDACLAEVSQALRQVLPSPGR